MTSDAVLARVLAALEAAGIPYMLTGSFASTYYGSPRATQDLNLVIEQTTGQLRRFVRSLPEEEYYVDLAAADAALERRSQFNVIDFETGWKIDLIIRKDRPFSREEFDRRETASLAGREVPVATAEDVILAKLESARSGASLRQIEDAAGILKARRDLDEAYLACWIQELGIENEWREARSAAGLE